MSISIAICFWPGYVHMYIYIHIKYTWLFIIFSQTGFIPRGFGVTTSRHVPQWFAASLPAFDLRTWPGWVFWRCGRRHFFLVSPTKKRRHKKNQQILARCLQTYWRNSVFSFFILNILIPLPFWNQDLLWLGFQQNELDVGKHQWFVGDSNDKPNKGVVKALQFPHYTYSADFKDNLYTFIYICML